MTLEIKGKNVDNRKDGEGFQEANVFNAAAQPLPYLRASARLPAQVWVVQDLFPGTGAERRDPRSLQI